MVIFNDRFTYLILCQTIRAMKKDFFLLEFGIFKIKLDQTAFRNRVICVNEFLILA